jgi:hypothetical protein
VAARDGVANTMLRLYANFVVVDNLEFTGLYWSGVPAYGSSTTIQIAAGTPGIGTNLEIKNVYIHGWSHNTAASGTSEHPCAIVGDTGVPNNNVNTIVHHSVIDGSDTAKDSCSAIFGSPPYIEHNYINYVTSGIIANGTVKIDGNTITNIVPSFDPGAHTNGIEINASRDVIISNNLIAHLGRGTLGIWTAPNAGYAAYIFNNLLYNTDTSNVVDLAAPVVNSGCTGSGTYCSSAGSNYVYNNTIECGPDAAPDAVCVAGIASAVPVVELKNNHFITNATFPNKGVWSTKGGTIVTETNNVVNSLSVAISNTFTSGQQYPFSPVSVAVVSSGANLTSLCSTSLPGLCSDTSLGVQYDFANHTVVGPGRTPKPRPASGPWEAGAYHVGAILEIMPPTTLSALVQ